MRSCASHWRHFRSTTLGPVRLVVTMPPLRCLVTVATGGFQTKRTLTLQTGSIECLKQAIATCPVLGRQVQLSRSRFQVLDKNFDEYVDLAPGDDLPDMAKVIVHQVPAMSSEEPCSSRSQEMPSHAAHEVPSDAPIEVPREATGDSSWQGACSSVSAIELPAYSDDDGNSFTMPSFGSLHDVIVAGKRLESPVYRGIVDRLFAAMVKISVIPGELP